MTYLGLAANKITRGAKDGQIDWDALTAGWDATLGGQLAAIAEQACDFESQPEEAGADLPSQQVRERVIEQALASVQAAKSAWTRSELMKNLAWAMGQEFAHLSPDAWHQLLGAPRGAVYSCGAGRAPPLGRRSGLVKLEAA